MRELISFLSAGQILIVAYTGPGAGLTMLGSLLAVVVLLLLALLAPFMYALRLIVKVFGRTSSVTEAVPVEATEPGALIDRPTTSQIEGH